MSNEDEKHGSNITAGSHPGPRILFRPLSVCASCWQKRYPNRPAISVNNGEKERCINCEETTTSGIYVRMRVEWA